LGISDSRGFDLNAHMNYIRFPALNDFYQLHPGVELRADLESIFHRCHLLEVAFIWELTKGTIHLPLGRLPGGFGGKMFAVWNGGGWCGCDIILWDRYPKPNTLIPNPPKTNSPRSSRHQISHPQSRNLTPIPQTQNFKPPIPKP
jgi:hypothetical protein